jgi:phosphoenolpyruvate mutase
MKYCEPIKKLLKKEDKRMKIVDTIYIGMTVDILHNGHINIINNAKKYGDVIVGLLTDSAIDGHKRLPYLTWEQRKEIVGSLAGVARVVPQMTWDYSENILKYKPNFMIHGDDWLLGPEAEYRDRAINALNSYGGKLVEIPYTKGISSGAIADNSFAIGTTPDVRRGALRRLLAAKPLCKFIEAHSPISALIGESCNVLQDGLRREFDGFWSSSLTDSTEMGKPDIEALEISTRLTNINNIFEVTTKPLIMDADTGGKLEHFEIHIKSMERLGISAVIIEDKTGLKKNSLFGTDIHQEQEDPNVFAQKIKAAKKALVSKDFMLIARIESLILEKGVGDALERAKIYVESGVDGIMIHSRKKDPAEVFEFAKIFRQLYPKVPLVAVPTSYNQVTEDQLSDHGFNIVIYANHMLRAAYPAMSKVAKSILENKRSLEVDEQIISINEILELIPGTK